MSLTCKECGAKCCRYFCFEIDEPDTYEEFEDIRWFLMHEGVTVHMDEDDDWYISIDNRCKMLGPDNRCKIYDDRPIICRRYDMSECDHSGGDYEYQVEFHTPEDVEAYARKTLGEKKFETAKARALAKIEKKHKKKTRKKKKK